MKGEPSSQHFTFHEDKNGSVPKMIIGWREWVSLPDWDIRRLLAKVDTGARTSVLHAENIRELPGDRVAFNLVLSRTNPRKLRAVETKIRRLSRVRPMSGVVETRYVVSTSLRLAGIEKQIEVNLIGRDDMLCRMLLGRTALEPDFLVDPGCRTLHSRENHR